MRRTSKTLIEFIISKINKMKNLLIFISLLLFAGSAHAQTFFGSQSINRNTFFFSLSLQSEGPHLGVGYNYRTFGPSFADYQLEWRMPMKNLYDMNNFQMIAGVYKPLALNRTYLGVGGHLRWEKEKDETTESCRLLFAATVMPSLYYSSTRVTDKLFGTTGLRITYAPTIVGSYQAAGEEKKSGFFSEHRLEVGLHLDAQIERSLGIGIDGYGTKTFGSFDDDDSIELEGNLYIGMSYSLDRL